MHTQAMETILYTGEDCVYCTMLKLRLAHEKIGYTEVTDAGLIRELGFETVPRLQISGRTMDFDQSVAWLNSQDRSLA